MSALSWKKIKSLTKQEILQRQHWLPELGQELETHEHTPPVQGQDSLEILSPFEQKIRTGLFPKKCLFPQNLHEKATLWFNCELIRFGTDSNGFGTNHLPALRGFYVLMKQTSRTTRKSALSSHFYLLFQVPAPAESSNLSAPCGLCSPA